ncbi:AlwI family type II restriction endonuclease, partial [Clostridium botulinum]|nr:AlwI family type II restriction endonuclease [Clostridium botulinum]
METLWSMSTTIREAERIVGFVQTASKLEGEEWNKETQKKFQILLIKNRQYLNNSDNTQTFKKLNQEQCNLLKNKHIDMTYEQAEDIFQTKNYKDPDMRGRQSMSPLVKLGLVYIVNDKIWISDVGKKLSNNEIEFDAFMLDSLLKFQYPNPCESGYKDWNTKPFINTLRLIKKVNILCKQKGIKEKGISKNEFGIFALSLKSYDDVDLIANKIIEFRIGYEKINDEDEKNNYIKNYINEYLSNFKNPEKNIKEYTDNMIRYIRLTKYIYI